MMTFTTTTTSALMQTSRSFCLCLLHITSGQSSDLCLPCAVLNVDLHHITNNHPRKNRLLGEEPAAGILHLASSTVRTTPPSRQLHHYTFEVLTKNRYVTIARVLLLVEPPPPVSTTSYGLAASAQLDPACYVCAVCISCAPKQRRRWKSG
jgi:hypothetical protein